LGIFRFYPLVYPLHFLPLHSSIRFGQQRIQTERPTVPVMVFD
jgi:hypothetical protein